MQKRRIDIDERHAGDTANQRDEAVEIGAAANGNSAAHHDEAGAKGILLPLGAEALFAAAVAKDLALEDAHGGEELDGVADEDGESVDELHGVDEAGGLGEVVDDFDLGALAKGGVAEGADGGEDAGDEEHDDGE